MSDPRAMALLALVCYAVYLLISFGLRMWLQWRATGDCGFRGVRGRPGSPEWLAGALFVAALATGIAGPVAGLAGLPPVAWLDSPLVNWLGVALAIVGGTATVAAQAGMGTSWRLGVDDAEVTPLVRTGMYAWVRNPIFTAMIAAGGGLALMVPNAIALSGWVLLVVAIQLQVRVVEEPHLLNVHGQAYRAYAAATGRFVPELGTSRWTNR